MGRLRTQLGKLRSALKRPDGVKTSSFLDEGEDLALLFCADVLGLESLHWGFWGDDAPTWEGLRAAQERFSVEVFKSIPEGVKSVLDVGCGLGDNARMLAERGHKVTAISPDAKHERHFQDQEQAAYRFERTGIEDFETQDRFDLALMSESSHFFDMRDGFAKLNEVLEPGGYLLTASMFRQGPSAEFRGFHVEEEWTRCAQEYGYEVVERRDITDNVLPTATIIRDTYQRYVPPTWNILDKITQRASLPARLVFSLLLGKQLAEIRTYLLEGFVAQVADPELFRARARYVVVLLKRV